VELTFVVSTGRAGSTMLSRVLCEHPQVLSVSELFAALQGVLRRHPYPGGELSGADLWRILSTPDPIADALVRDGMRAPEMIYPYGSGRFSPATGVPVICHTTLPMLTGDPDALYDQLAAEIPGWPTRAAADQHLALLGHLAALLGRPVIVERSGGSLPLMPLLRREFPEARFIHIQRDGCDCALSMSRYPMFRLGVVTYWAALDAGLHPLASLAEIQAALPPAYRGLLSAPYDMTRLAEHEIPLTMFGEVWADIVCRGVPALTRLPEGSLLTLRYEDLLTEPGPELARLAGFLGVTAPPAWLAAAREEIEPARAGKSAGLDGEALAALRAACEPGERALAELARAAGLARPAGPAEPAGLAGRRAAAYHDGRDTEGVLE
jgi:hypothetical protein